MKAARWSLLCVCLLCIPAFAFEPFVVQDIRVEGLRRISAGTVFNYLPVKVGETFDERRSGEAIRALFKTGFFEDVRLERDGSVLVVSVRERPAIAEVTFSGNKLIKKEQLRDALKQIGLAEGRVFDRSLLERVQQELQGQYFSEGKYGVKITTTTTPLERNRVAISIQIDEGKTAKIRGINLVGNRDFSDKELLKKFKSGTGGLFSFYTKKDRYSKQKLAGDLETLRSFYLDRGYINFNIDSTQVTITPDKQSIYITVNLNEGEPFTVEEVKLAGDLVVAPEELFPLVTLTQGEVFSRKRATETADQITERLGDEGYIFANVNTIPDVDEENKTVRLTFFVDPGKRVYVRRINMKGNTKTRDEVLRREMRQMEGAIASNAAIKRSRTRLERLGYFEEVNVETKPVAEAPDQVDVDYTVVERPSGTLMLGVGFAQTEGFLINASVTQDNFLGSGKRVSVEFNNSRVNTVYSFDYTNPYYTIDGVSRGFGFFYRQTDAEEANVSNYSTDRFGGRLSFGAPLSEDDRVRINFGADRTKLKPGLFPAQEITDFVAENGDTFNNFSTTLSWRHDTRNRAIFADSGTVTSLELEASIPGSTLQFYKANLRQLFLVPLWKGLTFSWNTEFGYGDGYGNDDDLPLFENFFAGGARSVRGYNDNTLGPVDSQGNPLGGNAKFTTSLEFILPPFFEGAAKSFRLSAFVDAGNVYNTAQGADGSGPIRASAGVSALWLTPVGPLTFSLARPLNDQPGDDTQVFQFSIGAPFFF